MKVITAKQAYKETLNAIMVQGLDGGVLRSIFFNITNACLRGESLTDFEFNSAESLKATLYTGRLEALGYKVIRKDIKNKIYLAITW